MSTSITNQFPSLFCYFISGMLLLFAYEWIKKHWIVVIPAIVLVILNFLATLNSIKVLTEITIYFEPIALGIIILFLAFHSKPFNSVGLEKDYSYLIYLWHFPIIRCLIETMKDTQKTHPIFFILNIISLAFMCSFFFACFERKSKKLKDNSTSVL